MEKGQKIEINIYFCIFWINNEQKVNKEVI